MAAIQSVTRKSIRQSVGYALNDMIIVTASTTGDTSSIIAAYSLARGGDDEYNGRQVYMATPVGSIAAGEKSWVSDFDNTPAGTADATCAPVFTASTIGGDVFELWRVFTVEEINDAINQAIMEVTGDCVQIKQTSGIWTASKKYEYDVLSSYVALSQVEYVASTGTEYTLDSCNDVWTAGSANVTVTADTSFNKEGSACVKAVEDGNSGTNAILCYKAITSTDIDDCTKVEFWMYSSIALTAGQLQIKLDDTAAIASALEAIDIPAMDATTWYRHSLTLANPHSDVDIISIGIFQVADVGAFTFYVDDVKAIDSLTRQWKILTPEYWRLIKDTTNYLHITSDGLSATGNPTQLRLTGYQLPALLSADATTSEIDPQWIIDRVTGRLLMAHAKSARLDISDRESKGKMLLDATERKKAFLRVQPANNTRWI